jgi:hypothetical protein
MEGTYAVDKAVSATERGLMYDNTSNFSIGTDDHFYIWVRGATPGICDTQNNRGIHVAIGDDTSNFVKFHVAGSDTLPYGGSFPYAIRFLNTTLANKRTLVGTPGTTPSWIGAGLKTTGTSKGPNLGVDAARIGTGYDITGGTGVDDPGNFAGLFSNDSTTSEGVFTAVKAGYRLQGKLRFGSSTSECEFEDLGIVIVVRDTEHSLTDFNEILIENASTVFDLTACTFQGLGTNSPGRFEMVTVTADVNLTQCTFKDFGDILLGSGASCLACTFVNTDQITAKGADLTGSKVSGYEGTANTSVVIWNTATDPDGYLDEMEFIKGTVDTHAIEFGTTSPTTLTLRDQTFTSYSSSNNVNSSTFHIKRTTGTVTINHVGTTGNLSYRTDGATVIVQQNPVTFTVHVIDQATGSNISGARVHIEAGTTGPLPSQDSVTITRSGSTASVSHTAHGLSDGDEVFIEGANEKEYNGVYTITNVTTNAYDYTVTGTPATPATGTITSTAVIISGTTNASGLITDTRSLASDQDFTGRIRLSSTPPLYRTSRVNGTIDFENGLTYIVQMVKDE